MDNYFVCSAAQYKHIKSFMGKKTTRGIRPSLLIWKIRPFHISGISDYLEALSLLILNPYSPKITGRHLLTNYKCAKCCVGSYRRYDK